MPYQHVPLHDIGHVPQLEAPRDFSAELRRFARNVVFFTAECYHFQCQG